MTGSIKGSWLSPIVTQLNSIGRDLGDLSTDTPTDLARPEETFHEAEQLGSIAEHGPTGWAKRKITQTSLPDAANNADLESEQDAEPDQDEERAKQTLEDFLEAVGNEYGMGVASDSTLSPDAFQLAFWRAVRRGRDPSAGVKHVPVPSQTLTSEPEAMRCGSKRLKPYQLQDVGQACQIDNSCRCVFLLHDMGLGKTIQAIAICEQNGGGPVLIVVPAILINTWLEELHKTVPGRKVLDYRRRFEGSHTCAEVEQYDYVVTSYHLVEREFTKGQTFAKHQGLRMAGREFETIEPTRRQILEGGEDAKTKQIPIETKMPSGILHSVAWYRVVCDEGHHMRSNGKTTTAVCSLKRKHGILITGTPQHNGHKDWFAAFRFAHLKPFSTDEARFKEYFVNKNRSSINDYLPLDKNRARILSLMVRGISVRRHKADRFNGELPFPAITTTEHDPILVEPDDGSQYPHHPETEKHSQQVLKHHWDRYVKVVEGNKTTYREATEKASHDVQRPKLKKHIFAEMTEARQATAHPAVVKAPKLSRKKGKLTNKSLADYNKWLATFRQDPEKKKWRSSIIYEALKLIRRHARAMRKGEPGSGGGIVVFCQFLPVLDILNIAVREDIRQRDVGCLQLDGRLTGKEKDENLEKFKAQGSLKHLILLTTPKSGGEGLNLPQASCIILLTPHFNPYVDIQAKSRATRPGQTRQVHIWTIAMKDSFDVRIGFMQDRKVENAEGITEWDRNQLAAVAEAESWNAKSFNDEIRRIWVDTPRRSEDSEDEDLTGFEDEDSPDDANSDYVPFSSSESEDNLEYESN